jgi:hypothetical protein
MRGPLPYGVDMCSKASWWEATQREQGPACVRAASWHSPCRQRRRQAPAAAVLRSLARSSSTTASHYRLACSVTRAQSGSYLLQLFQISRRRPWLGTCRSCSRGGRVGAPLYCNCTSALPKAGTQRRGSPATDLPAAIILVAINASAADLPAASLLAIGAAAGGDGHAAAGAGQQRGQRLHPLVALRRSAGFHFESEVAFREAHLLGCEERWS